MTIWIHRTNLSVNQRIWFVTELTEIGFLRVHFQAAEVRTYRKSIRECWSRRFRKQTESQQDLVELFLWSTSLVKELVILLVFFFFFINITIFKFSPLFCSHILSKIKSIILFIILFPSAKKWVFIVACRQLRIQLLVEFKLWGFLT